jgi:hypothetical protein
VFNHNPNQPDFWFILCRAQGACPAPGKFVDGYKAQVSDSDSEYSGNMRAGLRAPAFEWLEEVRTCVLPFFRVSIMQRQLVCHVLILI